MTRAYKIVRFFFLGIVKLIFNIRVVGAENEPKDGAVLVCSNHISATDPVVVCAAMKHQVCYMAKKELFKIPVLSWLIRTLGAFPVDRSGKDVGAIKKAISLLESEKRVGIFPQGTRQAGVNPRDTKLKNGAAMIASKTGVNILPVYIHCKGNKSRLFKRTTVIIGKPISFDSLAYNNEDSGEYGRISNIVFDEICKLGEDFEKCVK